MEEAFRKFAAVVSTAVGSMWAPVVVVALLVGTGFYFNFSDVWESNASFTATITSIFLLCFLQHSQNHSDKASHLKLDELIKNFDGARDEVMSLEKKSRAELNEIEREAESDSDPETELAS
jgi:low affinity Fe/Cu permease